MADVHPPTPSFAYRAQALDGQPFTGTIDAASADEARQRLEALRLRIIELAPSSSGSTAPAAAAMRGEDFLTFNQQLAYLAEAGMPMERGLRLIATDLRRGRI